jgi:hypothetical protein
MVVSGRLLFARCLKSNAKFFKDWANRGLKSAGVAIAAHREPAISRERFAVAFHSGVYILVVLIYELQ